MTKLEFVKAFTLQEEDRENFDPNKSICVNRYLGIENTESSNWLSCYHEIDYKCDRCWNEKLEDFEVIYLLGKLTQKLRSNNRSILKKKNKKIKELKEEIELYKNACIVSDNKFFNLKEAFEQLKESYEKIIDTTEDIENERVDE